MGHPKKGDLWVRGADNKNPVLGDRGVLLPSARAMSSGWIEMSWNPKNPKKETRKRCRRSRGSVGPATPSQRKVSETVFDLAGEAVAMQGRSAFDAGLQDWARDAPRGKVVYAVLQAVLCELRRVGHAAFLSGESECHVRSASTLELPSSVHRLAISRAPSRPRPRMASRSWPMPSRPHTHALALTPSSSRPRPHALALKPSSSSPHPQPALVEL